MAAEGKQPEEEVSCRELVCCPSKQPRGEFPTVAVRSRILPLYRPLNPDSTSSSSGLYQRVTRAVLLH